MRPEEDFAGRQSLGAREEQEDAYAFSPLVAEAGGETISKLLLVVADGMGGHVGGARASSTAVETFVETFWNYLDASRTNDAPALLRALLAANERIGDVVSASGGQLVGMGTTLLAVTVSIDRLQWISVGDCSLHLLRGGEIVRLNSDHSCRPSSEAAAAPVAPGEVPGIRPGLSALKSALVGGEIELADIAVTPRPLIPGDVVIFSTDGLRTLSDERIRDLIAPNICAAAADLAHLLLDAVEETARPKQDNTTVAVAKIPS